MLLNPVFNPPKHASSSEKCGVNKKINLKYIDHEKSLKSLLLEYFKENKDLSNSIQERIPTSTIPLAEDIASCVDNLLSREWPSLTGVSLNIDGGTSLLYPGL